MEKITASFTSIPSGNIKINGEKIDENKVKILDKNGDSLDTGDVNFINGFLDSGILQIPKIGITQPFRFSESESQMDESIWLFSKNKSLEEKLIFGAHRYDYNDPEKSFFFNIQKLENGDEVKISDKIWRVYDKKIVKASEVEILNPSNEKILILFSCDPYWSGENRIVIFARIVE